MASARLVRTTALPMRRDVIDSNALTSKAHSASTSVNSPKLWNGRTDTAGTETVSVWTWSLRRA